MRAAILAIGLAVGCGGEGSGAPDGGLLGDSGGLADAPAGDVDAAPAGDADAAPACGGYATFADGLGPTAIVHVAPGGDDDSGDGSEGAPFATIEGALSSAAPGTAIRLHAGTYPADQSVSDLRGTASAPIWIGGAPGEARPVLSGGSQGLHLSRVSYLVIHDLEVTGSAANGINTDDGGDVDDPTATHHIVFRNLSIHDVGSGGNQDCLKLSGLYDYWVLGSSFARCGGGGSGSGVDHVGCHRGVIGGNDFRELSGSGVQNKGGSTDILIHGNRLEDAGERSFNLGGATGFQFFRPSLSTTDANAEARRIHAVANLIIGSVAPAAFAGCTDCLFANNTVVDPDNWVARILQETTGDATYSFDEVQNGRFVNNLVYFTAGDLSTTVNVGPNTMAGTFTFANNLWYAHDDPGSSAPSLPVTESGGVVGDDPGLDASYRIGATSPAAGAGTAVPEVTADFAGNCYGSPPSIGAFAVD